VVTTVLVGILGTGAASERAADADAGVRPLVESLTRFPAWSSDTLVGNGDLNLAIAAKLVALLVTMFGLAYLAGRAGSGPAAFIGGWGAMVLTCAMAGGLYYVIADLTAFDGDVADRAGGALSPLVEEMNAGAVFALYTGWLVAAAVAVTRRTTRADAATGAATAATAAPLGPTTPPRGVPPQPSRPLVQPTAASRHPIATWPPMPAQVGTVPPSPAWAPPRSTTPLPAVALPRRAAGAYSDAPARDRTASGLPRRPVPPRPPEAQPPPTPDDPTTPG
jgi:hypothetical protein